MKLLSQSHSPFARKVVVLIEELGLQGISIEHHETSPTRPEPQVSVHNPLGQVPVLILEGGEAIFDSAVICRYLDATAARSLQPTDALERARDEKLQALASGLCEAGIALRWDTDRRPEHLRWDRLADGFRAKIAAGLAALEASPPHAGSVTHGAIALATALDWLRFRNIADFRHVSTLADWLKDFCRRPSMIGSAYAGATHD